MRARTEPKLRSMPERRTSGLSPFPVPAVDRALMPVPRLVAVAAVSTELIAFGGSLDIIHPGNDEGPSANFVPGPVNVSK